MQKLLLTALFIPLLMGGCNCGRNRSSEDVSPSPSPSPTPHPGSITVTVSPASTSVEIGGTQTFTATVTGTANQAVTWELSGSGCGECGAINTTTGRYVAPDVVPNPATLTVTARSVEDNQATGDATVRITTGTNETFVDQYAFLLTGFDGHPSPVAIAGSLRSNGNGGITSGVMDVNHPDGPQQSVQITGGSYSFGGDHRGRLTLNTPGRSYEFRFAMNWTNPPTYGRIIAFESDGSRLIGSGVIKKQTVTALSGNFAFGFTGGLDSGRAGAVGTFSISGTTVNSGAMDLNLNGEAKPISPLGGSIQAPSAVGRGTAVLNCAEVCPLNFSYYVVSAEEALFIGTDERNQSRPMLGGRVLKKSGTTTALSGPLVFYLTGMTGQTSGSGTEVSIGRFDASPGTLSGTLDQNSAGSIPPTAPFTGSSSVESNGRGTLNFNVPLCAADSPCVFYMVGTNKAFLLQSQASEVGAGFMEAQSGGPFAPASVAGNSVVGTLDPAQCGCASASGVVDINGPGANFLGSRDKSNAGGIFPRDNFSGTLTVSANGRGTLAATSSTPTENWVLYVVSSDRAFAIDADQGNYQSVVTVFEK